MKLVIKLDDKTYKEVMDRTEFDTLSLGIKLIEAVQNSTPLEEELEKIKEKINSEDVNCRYDEYAYSSGLQKAIELIDTCIEELKGENK